jgi:hypothetical protein
MIVKFVREIMNMFKMLGILFSFVVSSQIVQGQSNLTSVIQNTDSMSAFADNQYLGQNNINQNLTWGESYVLEALVNMYDVTGNLKYLDMFIKHADEVINNRDDRAGQFQVFPVWSTKSKVYDNQAYGFTVCSGMITYPIARFIHLVKKSLESSKFSGSTIQNKSIKTFSNKYLNAANRYLPYIEETLSWHIKREYRETSSLFQIFFSGQVPIDSVVPWFLIPTSSGYGSVTIPGRFGFFSPLPETSRLFLDSRGRSMQEWFALPFNMQNALGRTAAVLYSITKKPEYLRVASSLYNYYRLF